MYEKRATVLEKNSRHSIYNIASLAGLVDSYIAGDRTLDR